MDTTHIDVAMSDLQANKSTWATASAASRLDYLDSIKASTVRVARGWVEASVKAKGLSMDGPLAGEEWTSGPYAVLALVNALKDSIGSIVQGRPLSDGYKVHRSVSDQVVVDVFPTTLDERLLYSGVTAEVWMKPGVTEDSLAETMGRAYSRPSPDGDVSVVLAAGNIASIAPLDVINAMFNEGSVVMLKMNPVNDYLGPFLEEAFADLIADGFLRLVYGGTEVGKYLTTHPEADSIHLTGSASTYNAIVFGQGADGETNRRNGTPTNTRRIAAELGGVGPIIVVPGEWSKADLRFQADQIVSQKMHNSGFNCVAAQVVVLPQGWDQADALLDEVRALLKKLDDRDPYYPGALDRCEAAVATARNVETFGSTDPRYLVTDVDSSDGDNELFTTELFAPTLVVTSLPCPDVPSYLTKAVRFANDSLFGTLGANWIIHPKTEKKYRGQFAQAVADLEYGTIAINTWTGVAYFMPKCAWGAFPGHPQTDIQSGTGFVHNVLMFGEAQKSVVRGPFAPSHRTLTKGEFHIAPKPVYSVGNKQAHKVGERLIEYEDTRSKVALAKVASAAVRG